MNTRIMNPDILALLVGALLLPWASATAQDVTRATYLFAVTGLVVMAIVALLRLGVAAI